MKAYKLLTDDLCDIETDFQYRIGDTHYYPYDKSRTPGGFYASTADIHLFHFPEEYQYKIYEVELNGEQFSHEDDIGGIFSRIIKIIKEIDITTISNLTEYISMHDSITSKNIKFLLKGHPFLVTSNELPIRPFHIAETLKDYPQLASKINKNKLKKIPGYLLAELIVVQPVIMDNNTIREMAKKLKGCNISFILSTQPHFIGFFDASKMNGKEISDVLRRQPILVNKLRIEKIKNITTLLIAQPQLIDYVTKKQLKSLSGTDIANIISYNLCLAYVLDVSRITDVDDVYHVIYHQPTLFDLFTRDNIASLTREHIVFLIAFHKELGEKLSDYIHLLSNDDKKYISDII